jgi:hypothetical protein
VSFSGGLVDSNRFDGEVSEDVVSSTNPAQGYAHLVYERPNFYYVASGIGSILPDLALSIRCWRHS